MSAKKEIGSAMLIGLGAIALYLISKGAGLFNPSTGGSVNLYGADPATGCPQFSSANSASIPAGQGLPALSDPLSGQVIAQPPTGYTLWKDVTTGQYWYFPTAVSGAGTAVTPVAALAVSSSQYVNTNASSFA